MKKVDDVIVTANKKLLVSYYAILGVCGALILGGHAYNYFYGDMMENWFLNFTVGLAMVIGGFGYAFEFFTVHIPEIHIDDKGIRSSKSIWDSSFNWEKLKKVELNKNRIEVQYANTGLKNSISIPYIIRLSSKNREVLNSGLSLFCDRHNVEFESKMNK